MIRDDEAAFCELYAMYKDRLLYFSMKFIKSREFAEDVFQDAFASVWQNRRFLNPDSPFAPYIYTIIKNRILNLLGGIEKEQELKKIIIRSSLDHTEETEHVIVDKDLNDLVKKALEQLTPRQRKVFEMSRNQLKSHKEIAEELQISVFTVQQHISASLKVIRTFLIKYAGVLHADILLLLICLHN
ncbi:MAG: RNA polymerase sigma-70 factor [Tannerellaceae bacterium]|nr:RNA polymerase sigma-70 factor [Tannerellaceae bacterium]